MAIRFDKYKVYGTPANARILAGVPRASIRFKLRMDGDGSPDIGGDILRREGDLGPKVWWAWRQAPGVCLINFQFTSDAAGAAGKAQRMLRIVTGVTYDVAMTYDQGRQVVYLNGLPFPLGSIAGNLPAGSARLLIGLTDARPNTTLDDLCVWHDYVLTPADIAGMRDGTTSPADVGAAATKRARWTLAGEAGTAPSLGATGLADSYGDAAIGFTTQMPNSTGTAAYAPAIAFAPRVAASAKVWTSGKSLEVAFAGPHGERNDPLVRAVDQVGKYHPGVVIYTPPVLSINGKPVGPLPAPLNTGQHETLWYRLPYEIEPGDAVTLSAPPAWADTWLGEVAPLKDAPVANRAGRSAITPDDAKRTLKIGLTHGHLGGSIFWTTYRVAKNMRLRHQYFVNSKEGVLARDARDFPTQLAKGYPWMQGPLVIPDASNGIDATGMPILEGLYLIAYGCKTAGSPSIETDEAANDRRTSIVERKDLAVAPVDGAGGIRVFDVRKLPTTTHYDLRVELRLTPDASGKMDFTYLEVYGPDDFEVVDGKVVADISDPMAISSSYKRRTATGLGSARWTDALLNFEGTSSCEPEHMMKEDRLNWAGSLARWLVRYKQARPWDAARTPYIYTPLYGEPFDATLGDDLHELAKPGDVEIVQIPDAATAPVIEGLVLTMPDGKERCRVMKVDGTAVTIERGSESTTPAAQPAGPVKVSCRHRMDTLAQWGPDRRQVTELVTDGPHRLRTGMTPPFSESGWPVLSYADGTKGIGGSGGTFNRYALAAYVTGPDSYVVLSDGATSMTNTTTAAPVDLDPAKCFADVHLPEGPGLPYAFIARAAKSSGADLHINFGFAASDAMVDEVARQIRDILPAGSRLVVEYCNEIWNWGYGTTKTNQNTNWIVNRTYASAGMAWAVRRTGQIAARVAARFDEGGRGRGKDVRAILSMQMGSWATARAIMDRVVQEGSGVPFLLAVAPYVEPMTKIPGLRKAFHACDVDQALDLWAWNMASNRGDGSVTATLENFKSEIDAYNAAKGTSFALYTYEGGVQLTHPAYKTTVVLPKPPTPTPAVADATAPAPAAVTAAVLAADAAKIPVADAADVAPGMYLRVGPEWVLVDGVEGNTLAVRRGQSGTAAVEHPDGRAVRNAWFEVGRDMVYHWRWLQIEQDMIYLWQRCGVERGNVTDFGANFVDGDKLWGCYHWLGEEPGRGDGTDGKADNRLTQCRPGPGQKSPATNHPANTVSVRGQGIIEWNRAFVTPPPPPPPPPPPAYDPVAESAGLADDTRALADAVDTLGAAIAATRARADRLRDEVAKKGAGKP